MRAVFDDALSIERPCKHEIQALSIKLNGIWSRNYSRPTTIKQRYPNCWYEGRLQIHRSPGRFPDSFRDKS